MTPFEASPIEEVERALLPSVLRWTLATTVVFAVIGVVAGYHAPALPALVPIATLLLCLWASTRFRPRAVGAAYFVGMSLYFLWLATIDGGTSGQAFYALVSLAPVAVLLMGRRGLWVVGPLLILGGLCLAMAEARGVLPSPLRQTPYLALLSPFAAFVSTVGTAMLMHGRLLRLLQQARTQAHVTAKFNKQLSLEMERRAQMDAELQLAAQRALEAARIKSTLLANVSHELRTPMNAVVGLTDLLLTQEPTATQREYLETVRLSSESLLVLLDDLLDLSKIESGVLQFESKPYSVLETVFDVQRLLLPRAEAKGITLEVITTDGVPPYVLGDAMRLRQVLVNLVGNAVKFTAEGGVAISVSWADDRVQLAVRDTGIGIGPEALERIFEPFVQADASTTRRFGGTGLGLSIVKRAIEAQHGRVHVTSVLGQGSTFTVTLAAPRTGSRPTVSTPNMPAVSAPMTPSTVDGLRVLLVEDNAVNELVAVRLLKHLGLTAEVARNGRLAVEACARQHFDIVLMDMQMPEMDGLEATRRLREGQGAQPYIIALTANATLEDRTNASQAGANAFLAKPVHLEDLRQALLKAANRLRMRAAS